MSQAVLECFTSVSLSEPSSPLWAQTRPCGHRQVCIGWGQPCPCLQRVDVGRDKQPHCRIGPAQVKLLPGFSSSRSNFHQEGPEWPGTWGRKGWPASRTQEATGESGHQGPGRTGTWGAFGPLGQQWSCGEVTPDPGPWAWGSLEGRQSSREYSCEPPPPTPRSNQLRP